MKKIPEYREGYSRGMGRTDSNRHPKRATPTAEGDAFTAPQNSKGPGLEATAIGRAHKTGGNQGDGEAEGGPGR